MPPVCHHLDSRYRQLPFLCCNIQAPNRQRVAYSACLAVLHGIHLARINTSAAHMSTVVRKYSTSISSQELSKHRTLDADAGTFNAGNGDVVDAFISGMLGLVALLCAPLVAGMFKPTTDSRYSTSGGSMSRDAQISHASTLFMGDGLGPYLWSLYRALGPVSNYEEDSTPSRTSSASTGSSGSTHNRSDGYRHTSSQPGRDAQSGGQTSSIDSPEATNKSHESQRSRSQQILHILCLHLPSATFQIMDMVIWIAAALSVLVHSYMTHDDQGVQNPGLASLPIGFVAASMLVLCSSAGLLLVGSGMAFIASQAQVSGCNTYVDYQTWACSRLG